MALINCPECNQPISDRAKVCPHCSVDLNAPKCADCGARLPADAAACPVCGCPVETTTPQPVPQPVPPPVPPINPGVAVLELPGPHHGMKTTEEWVVTDDTGDTVKARIKWGDTRRVELPLESSDPVWVMPEEQVGNKWKENFRRKIWPFHKVLMIICLVITAISLCFVLATVFSRVGCWRDSDNYYSTYWYYDGPVDKFLPADIWLVFSFFAANIALAAALLQIFMLFMHRKQPDATAQPGKLQEFNAFLVRYFPTSLLPTESAYKPWLKALGSCCPAIILCITSSVVMSIATSQYPDIVSDVPASISIIGMFFVLLPVLIFYSIFLPIKRSSYGRRTKYLQQIVTPGKRYNLVWQNRHTFSVSEYDA